VLYRSLLSGLKLRFDVLDGRGPENAFSLYQSLWVGNSAGWKKANKEMKAKSE